MPLALYVFMRYSFLYFSILYNIRSINGRACDCLLLRSKSRANRIVLMRGQKKVSVSVRGGLLLGLQPLLDLMDIPPHGTHTDLEARGEAGVVVPGLG